MILARLIGADRTGELELAFRRMGLPRPAREYLSEKLPALQVLLTGLERADASFLKACLERSVAPGREEYPYFAPGDVRHRPGSALLAGRREQLERLIAAARKESPPREGLATALERALRSLAPPEPIVLGGRTLELGRRTLVMGVVNVTPDSFSDGGRFLDPAAAIAHGERLASAGADLLDIGGESTRPGAAPVSAEEELARVLPVIRALKERTQLPLSIDTTKAAVAKEALAAGASLVNDISGLRFDPALPEVVASAGAACCVMHIRGTPETMQRDPRYQDVVAEVVEFLADGVERAERAGVRPERIWVDPGIGFGKTPGHNLFLLRRLVDLRSLGRPIVVGTSRKSFLGHLTGGKPPLERIVASAASTAALAVVAGADVVRVHDVAETKDALAVADAIRQASEGGDLFGPPETGARSP